MRPDRSSDPEDSEPESDAGRRPGHFAFDLPIVQVILPPGEEPSNPEMWTAAQPNYGEMINSGPFDGTLEGEAIPRVIAWLEEHEYHSVAQLKGSLSQKNCADPSAFERAQYMKAISQFPAAK